MDIFQFYAQNSNLINTIGINMLLGLSLYVTLTCGQLALGNVGFMSIGAFVSAGLTTHLNVPFGVATLVGMFTAMLAALILGSPLLRLRGVFLAIATLGFGEVVRVLFLNTDDLVNNGLHTLGVPVSVPLVITGGPLGLNGIPQLTQGWMILASVLAAAFFFARLRSSQIGYAFAAIREDEDAAEATGINVFAYKLLSLVLGAALAALAGSLDAHLHTFIAPGDYSFARAINILMYAIVGGTTLFLGTMLGAALLTLTPQILDALDQATGSAFAPLTWLKAYPEAFNGLLLLGVIILLPGGLGSLLARLPKRKTRTLSSLGSTPPIRAKRDPVGADSPLLTLDAISRNFGGVQALHNVSFAVMPGTIHGLIGPNGAGKTTLFNVISGLIPPSGGQLTFKSRVIQGDSAHQIAAAGMARTFQNIRLFRTLTVIENLRVGQHRIYHENLLAHLFALPAQRRAASERRNAAFRLLDQVGLAAYADAPASSLAYGDQRRLEIARALASQPDLLLLDEPAAGMNETETAQLQTLLRALLADGITILLVEHHMSLVMQVCTQLTVINFGQLLAEGAPEQISTNRLVIEAYLGREDDDTLEPAAAY